MFTRYNFSPRLRVLGLVIPIGIFFILFTSSCVTDAKVGECEFRIASTNTNGSGGAGDIGVTGEDNGSGGIETTNGIAPTGGEIRPPFAGTSGRVSDTEIQCTGKDQFSDFADISCNHELASEIMVLREENVWTATGEDAYAWGQPLVANLTDDNADGKVNLCDSPDILFMADVPFIPLLFTDYEYARFPFPRLIEGKDATLHDSDLSDLSYKPVFPGTTPAIGDIDRDGSPDIVAASRTNSTSKVFDVSVIAFERDGVTKWLKQTSDSPLMEVETLAISLADLDNKGAVEVIVGFDVFDGQSGELIVNGAEIIDRCFLLFFGLYGFNGVLRVAPTAADLDGDGDLEVVIGPVAFHHDRTIHYYDQSGFSSIAGIASFFSSSSGTEKPIYNIYPLVANLDDDSEPEVLFTAGSKVYILEHDGRLKKPPIDLAESGIDKLGPATVHDLNGDGESEIAFDTSLGLLVYDRKLEHILMNEYSEGEPGCVSSFDFRGDGVAELIYSDGHYLRLLNVKNGTKKGTEIARIAREGSKDCAVVADVDDDENAEIVVVNPRTADGEPSVQIIGERNSRWVPTRRIWNEHNYHVTNVLEDARIPSAEPPNWDRLNTFRTNVQVASDGFCIPIIK